MATDNSTPRPPKPAKIQRFKISVNIAIQFLTLVLILLMLNYLSFNHYRRWDFTRTHRYSLSEKTKHVLASLKKPVKVIVFFSTVSDITPDVSNLLKEYQYASAGKIEVEIVDPVRNPTRASTLENTYKFDKQENIVILDSNEHTKFINAVDMADYDTSGAMYGQPPQLRAFKGEQAITGGLLEITDGKQNKLYALTGHGERDLADADFAGIKTFIERENINIQPLDLQNSDAVPPDAAMLLIQGPRYDFTDREIKMLQDYWEKKGRILVLLDPNSQTPRLAGFLAEQGIHQDDDRILRVTQTEIAAIAGLVRDVTANFIEGSPITKNLKDATGFFIGGTQSLTFDAAKAAAANIHLQILAQASQGYWGETDYNLHEGDAVPYFDPKRDHGQPLAIVVSVEKGAADNPHVQVNSSRMVVAGNCEFISNKVLSAANANLDFTVNAVDWLLDRAELIGVAPKANKTLSMNLTDAQLTNTLSFMMVLIPGAVAVFGFALWWKRRH